MWRCPLNQGTRQCGNAGDAPLNQGTRQWGDDGDTLLIRGTGAQEADGSNARPRLRPLKDGQPHAHTAAPHAHGRPCGACLGRLAAPLQRSSGSGVELRARVQPPPSHKPEAQNLCVLSPSGNLEPFSEK